MVIFCQNLEHKLSRQYLFKNILYLPHIFQKPPEKGQKNRYFYIWRSDELPTLPLGVSWIWFQLFKGQGQGPYNTTHYCTIDSTSPQLTLDSKRTEKVENQGQRYFRSRLDTTGKIISNKTVWISCYKSLESVFIPTGFCPLLGRATASREWWRISIFFSYQPNPMTWTLTSRFKSRCWCNH